MAFQTLKVTINTRVFFPRYEGKGQGVPKRGGGLWVPIRPKTYATYFPSTNNEFTSQEPGPLNKIQIEKKKRNKMVLNNTSLENRTLVYVGSGFLDYETYSFCTTNYNARKVSYRFTVTRLMHEVVNV